MAASACIIVTWLSSHICPTVSRPVASISSFALGSSAMTPWSIAHVLAATRSYMSKPACANASDAHIIAAARDPPSSWITSTFTAIKTSDTAQAALTQQGQCGARRRAYARREHPRAPYADASASQMR
eukprot:CAMPEP_0183354508 /NCGR_PEP_ID=MMETSP0164_2-20130417/37354_1 /TAXON_ID=221442 /ORGANISM="Coccolithus pelagicus ssp braarudi, Strain PLY182g" /LENGTH=127 /DNA_ID=CAMNT_0025527405 /DNA_START=451 /DNA_END=835 /DNA_ORIENTATION=+